VAPSLSIELNFVAVRTIEEIDPAFSAMTRAHTEGLYVLADTFFRSQRTTLLKLAAKGRLPATYASSTFVEAGGLMSYGANVQDQIRRTAGYVDKILRGAKPGDLPIEQPTKFELVVNLKTARALGITIPESIMLQAD
jgi:putative ABC transport system substrate-binding protein